VAQSCVTDCTTPTRHFIFSAALIGVGVQLVGDKAASFVAFTESSCFIFEKVLFKIDPY